jgi:methyl-accepting chemotaxis protein
MKLGTKIINLTLAAVGLSVVAGLIVQRSVIRQQGISMIRDTMRAAVLEAESTRESMSTLNRLGAFDRKKLIEDYQKSGDLRNSALYKTVPVVAAWTAIQKVADQEGYEFRVPKNQARNSKNTPTPDEVAILAELEKGTTEEYFKIDSASNSIIFARPIKLTADCLACHGDPKTSPTGDGKDILGFAMENWKAGEVHGAFVLKSKLDRLDKVVSAGMLQTALWVLPLSAAIAIGIFYFVTRSITRPIKDCVALTGSLAQGDFSVEVSDQSRRRTDELGELAAAYHTMIGNTRTLLRDVSGGVQTLADSATSLSTASGQTAQSVKSMSEKTSTVAAAAEEASANTTSVAASIEQAATNLSSVASATEEMSATVGEIASNSEKARTISEQATAEAQTITALMQQLGQAAQEIGKVTETITDISSQTNLLALNATIEAARAGAAGKGFAVVANEIKELARQTAAATEDIKAKIAGVQTSTGGAIADIEKIAGVIKEVSAIVSSIAASIEEQAVVTKDVAGNISQASAGVRDSNERIAQTAEVSKSIARDMTGINSAVSDIRQGGDQLQASTTELSELAEQLKATTSQFRV